MSEFWIFSDADREELRTCWRTLVKFGKQINDKLWEHGVGEGERGRVADAVLDLAENLEEE